MPRACSSWSCSQALHCRCRLMNMALQAQRPYPQLHKLPQHSRSALEQVFGAARLANPCPEWAQAAQAPYEAPGAAIHGSMDGNGYSVNLPAPNGAPAGIPQVRALPGVCILGCAWHLGCPSTLRRPPKRLAVACGEPRMLLSLSYMRWVLQRPLWCLEVVQCAQNLFGRC